MLEPYSLEALQEDLQGFIFNIRTFNKKYASLFDLMFKTGLRIGEVTNIDRFIFLEHPDFKIITEKGSNDRIISSLEGDLYFQDMYNSNIFPFLYTSSSNATYFFKHYYKYSQVFVESKGITTHLFRHCLVKFWNELGFDIYYIADQLGEKDVKNIQLYIDSKLYYNPDSLR